MGSNVDEAVSQGGQAMGDRPVNCLAGMLREAADLDDLGW
jgi:hypothetical protein